MNKLFFVMSVIFSVVIIMPPAASAALINNDGECVIEADTALSATELVGCITVDGSASGIEFSDKGTDSLDLSMITEMDLSGLTSLGYQAFRSTDLSGLISLNLSSLESIGSHAFRDANLSGLTLIDLSNLESIGERVFQGTGLNSVTTITGLTDSDPTQIWKYYMSLTSSFHGTNLSSLTSLDLSSVESIGNSSFRGTDLSGLSMIEGFSQNMTPAMYSYLTTFSAFSGTNLSGLTSLDLSSVESTGNDVFRNADLSGLTSLDLSNLESTGNGIFYGTNLSGLTSLDLSNLESTGNGIFYGANLSGLTSLDLSSVGSAGNDIFRNANLSGLTSLDLSNVESIGNDVFRNANLSGLTSLDLSKVSSIGDRGFNSTDFSSLASLNLSGVNDIGYRAFFDTNLSGLTSFDLSNARNFGAEAFSGANLSGLTSLDLSSMESIGAGAFQATNLSGLTSLDLSSVESIGAGVFSMADLSGLISFNLSSIESIGDWAFYDANLSGLTSFDLSSVESIGDGAFYGTNLSNLTSLDLSGIAHIGENAFWGTGLNNLAELYLLGSTSLDDPMFNQLRSSMWSAQGGRVYCSEETDGCAWGGVWGDSWDNFILAQDPAIVGPARVAAIVTINDLAHLSNEDKAQFIQELNQAATVVEVEQIVVNAQGADFTIELAVAKGAAIADLENMNLTPEQKSAAIDAINNAVDLSGVTAAKNNAQSQSDVNTQLQVAKDAAIADLDNMNLTPEQKNAAIDAINNATNLDEINVAKGNAQSQSDVNNTPAPAPAAPPIVAPPGVAVPPVPTPPVVLKKPLIFKPSVVANQRAIVRVNSNPRHARTVVTVTVTPKVAKQLGMKVKKVRKLDKNGKPIKIKGKFVWVMPKTVKVGSGTVVHRTQKATIKFNNAVGKHMKKKGIQRFVVTLEAKSTLRGKTTMTKRKAVLIEKRPVKKPIKPPARPGSSASR